MEKILQPCDISDTCEPYIKEDVNKERLSQVARQYCDRLGAYRMPLGWVAIDLMRLLNGAQSLEKNDTSSLGTGALQQSLVRCLLFIHFYLNSFNSSLIF